MRGRKPTPTALRILRGNPSREPLPENEPKPALETPDMPVWLSKSGKTEWKRIVPELRKLGLLTLVDREGLAAYCQACSELEDSTRLLDKEGRILTTPIYVRGKKVGERKSLHPAVKVQSEAFGRLRAFVVEFGLTPASRTRIQAKPEEQEKDDLAEFMSG